jgi:YaiO family outer membrane protein
VAGAQSPDAAAADPLGQARTLATTGHRGEALQLLSTYLEAHPTDSDARNFYGSVLSWEGRYDEARAQLETVLSSNPTNGDALRALINVNTWDGRPEEAERLARVGLSADGKSVSFLLSQARALNAMQRGDDAARVVRQVLALDPSNEQALRLKRSLEDARRLWRSSTSYGADWFSDGRDSWREMSTSLTRQGTAVGSLIMRLSHADRFGYADNQLEVEAYPRIRPGTYANVGVAVSPQALLYPQYRIAADVYQSLGHGFEGSVGIRRLVFSGPVDIYVATMTKYRGSWMFTGRAFFIPDRDEGSRSFHGSVRRYFSGGAETYVALRYGHGFARQELFTTNDFVAIGSDTVAAEANMELGRRWTASVSGSNSRQERAGRLPLTQRSVSGGFSVRF